MPITHASLETDLRLAAALDARLEMLLADTAGVRMTGAVRFYGTVDGTGSDTKRVRQAGLAGTDVFAATAAEDTDVAETALTDGSADIAVVRAALRRDLGGLAWTTGFAEDITPEALARSMVISYERYFNSLVNTAIGTLSTTVGGGAGVDMFVDDFYDAMFTLQLASVMGPFFCMLHPRQVADFQESLRAEGGAIQWRENTAELLGIKEPGTVGTFNGVTIFQSTDIAAAAGAHTGGMWGDGAIGYATGTVPVPVGSGTTQIVTADGAISVEFQRNASSDTTEIVGNAYVGVSEIQDGKGVGIVTDD